MVVSAPDVKLESVEREEQSKPLPRRRNWFKLIAVGLALQVCALLFTEFVLYTAGLGEEEIFAFDKEVGTKHMTNKRVTWRSEGFGCTYFDANGMQDDNLTTAKPPNTYRVAVLGDSMVEGLQVHNEDKFTRILNKTVKLAGGKNIQVVNFGTSGYSTSQEYVQLKNQVFQYAPDMVLLCYDSRDIFENWSPADATLTNVRPVAICLPGKPLVVSNWAILQWMNSPRARFLKSINWLRENSRIWGLVSAMETELSFNNQAYKWIMDLFTHPGKTLANLQSEITKPEHWNIQQLFTKSDSSKPSFHIQFFEGKDPNAQVNRAFKAGRKKKAGANAAAKPQQPAEQKVEAPKKPPTEGERKYIELVSNTLGALISEMNTMCKQHNTKLVVASLPARLGVTPYPGQDTTMYGLDYAGEIDVVKNTCGANNIPFLDMCQPATELKPKAKVNMFYALHLSPSGHKFIADRLKPFLEKECTDVGR